MKDLKQFWWVFLLIGAVLLFSSKGVLPKEAVENIQGQSCAEDTDCPCLGTYNYTTALAEPQSQAIGIGVGQCTSGTCDMTYCLGLEPIGRWVKDNPWDYLRTKPAVALAIAALFGMAIFWPKR